MPLYCIELFHHFKHITENYCVMDATKVLPQHKCIGQLRPFGTGSESWSFHCFRGLMCSALTFSVVSASYGPPLHSTVKPGFPVPVNTNSPGVHKAARFGVYRYNNSSNDLFLFKESQIKKAMVQVRKAQTPDGPSLRIDLSIEHRHGNPDPPQGCCA